MSTHFLDSHHQLLQSNLIELFNLLQKQQQQQMQLEGLVKIKKLKGKQNKKKWVKNVDVSGLLENIENQDNQAHRAKYQQPLVVEDTTQKPRNQLHPDRFKNRPRSAPKVKYDNSYKREDFIADGMDDVWKQAIPAAKKRPELIVPAIIKPSSGHSYNPRKEDIDEIIEEVIDYEGKKPKKQKKIKKIKEVKVIPRSRNKKVREEYLAAVERRRERLRKNQLNSIKSLNKEIEAKNKMIEEKIEEKVVKKKKIEKEAKLGKVREGPKIGKKKYKYRQYIPSEEEIGKKISNVGLNDELMKDRFDSIFRRGILEPRSIKVHRNKTKNIKVKEQLRSE